MTLQPEFGMRFCAKTIHTKTRKRKGSMDTHSSPNLFPVLNFPYMVFHKFGLDVYLSTYAGWRCFCLIEDESFLRRNSV
uniref:Uncharacterized protein n=1 Tax=Rhizophora mucronata TaxID=61149 RepID=A0A2P2QEV3_RHIMU